jgi:hypothetical protein
MVIIELRARSSLIAVGYSAIHSGVAGWLWSLSDPAGLPWTASVGLVALVLGGSLSGPRLANAGLLLHLHRKRAYFFSGERAVAGNTRRRAADDRLACSRKRHAAEKSWASRLLFPCSMLAFARYTVAMRRARLDGLHAAAISAVGSRLIYMPPHAILAGAGIFDASLSAVAFQALVQGLLMRPSRALFDIAVSIPSASSGAAFAASCLANDRGRKTKPSAAPKAV